MGVVFPSVSCKHVLLLLLLLLLYIYILLCVQTNPDTLKNTFRMSERVLILLSAYQIRQTFSNQAIIPFYHVTFIYLYVKELLV